MSKSTPNSLNYVGVLSCLGTLICWSSAPLFIEYLTGHLDLWTQNLLRYAAACLFWLPFLIADARAGRLPKAVWNRALLPFIPNIIMQTLWAAAFYYIDPGFASLLSMTGFLWVIILSIIFFAEEKRLLGNRLFRLSILLSVVGLAGVIFFHPAFMQSYTKMGITIVLLYGLIWGFYGVAVKIAFRDIDSRTGFSVVSIYTVVALFILTMFMGQPQKCLDMPLAGWVATVVSGVTGIALGHVLYYTSIRRLGSTTPSLVQLAQPFVVAVISYFVFSEVLNPLQWGFGIVLIAGSALAIAAKKNLSPPTT
ncbi:MAG: DMT family transporter [Planctomycetota bacterium]